MRALALLLLLHAGKCFRVANPIVLQARSSPSLNHGRSHRIVLIDDADLMASLKARLKATTPPPLGIDGLGADSMGPHEVISHVMSALLKRDFRTVLGFSAKDDGAVEDTLGQVVVGAFTTPDQLNSFLASHTRYATLTRLTEWKPIGRPDMTSMSRKVRSLPVFFQDHHLDLLIHLLSGFSEAARPARWGKLGRAFCQYAGVISARCYIYYALGHLAQRASMDHCVL